jgi:drug/metabolite transporter (DMT)-like permease
MKKFAIFFVCSVVATVLMNYVYHWLGFDKAGTASNMMPVLILFLGFYVFDRKSIGSD